MNKKLVWLSAVALSLIVGQSSATSSTTSNKEKSCNCHHTGQNLSSKLNLSDEQKAKIKAIRAQAHKDAKANYQQLKVIKHQMNVLSSADKIDEAKLNTLISQRNKIKSTMMRNHVTMMNQIYNTLTAQQKAQYKEMQLKWIAKHQ